MPPNEKISSLGILAYERKSFINALIRLKNAFKVKIKNTEFVSQLNAKEAVQQMFGTISHLFNDEIKQMITQYDSMIKSWTSIQKDNSHISKISKWQEEQILIRDRLYEVIPLKFIELINDFEVIQQKVNRERADPDLTIEEIASHNSLLKEPLGFYSGYIQLSMNTKDEIMESLLTEKYLKSMKHMKSQLEMKDEEIKAMKLMIEIYSKE